MFISKLIIYIIVSVNNKIIKFDSHLEILINSRVTTQLQDQLQEHQGLNWMLLMTLMHIRVSPKNH
jgi:hypothetical protein